MPTKWATNHCAVQTVYLLSATLRQEAREKKNISLWGMASPSAKRPCVVLFVNVRLKREEKQQRETDPKLRSDIFDITDHR